MTPQELDQVLRPWLTRAITSNWHQDLCHPLDPEQCRLLADHISGNLCMVLVGMLEGETVAMEPVADVVVPGLEEAMARAALEQHAMATNQPVPPPPSKDELFQASRAAAKARLESVAARLAPPSPVIRCRQCTPDAGQAARDTIRDAEQLPPPDALDDGPPFVQVRGGYPVDDEAPPDALGGGTKDGETVAMEPVAVEPEFPGYRVVDEACWLSESAVKAATEPPPDALGGGTKDRARNGGGE